MRCVEIAEASRGLAEQLRDGVGASRDTCGRLPQGCDSLEARPQSGAQASVSQAATSAGTFGPIAASTRAW